MSKALYLSANGSFILLFSSFLYVVHLRLRIRWPEDGCVVFMLIIWQNTARAMPVEMLSERPCVTLKWNTITFFWRSITSHHIKMISGCWLLICPCLSVFAFSTMSRQKQFLDAIRCFNEYSSIFFILTNWGKCGRS